MYAIRSSMFAQRWNKIGKEQNEMIRKYVVTLRQKIAYSIGKAAFLGPELSHNAGQYDIKVQSNKGNPVRSL